MNTRPRVLPRFPAPGNRAAGLAAGLCIAVNAEAGDDLRPDADHLVHLTRYPRVQYFLVAGQVRRVEHQLRGAGNDDTPAEMGLLGSIVSAS